MLYCSLLAHKPYSNILSIVKPMLTKNILICSTTVEGEGCSVITHHEERLGFDNELDFFPLSSLSSLKVCPESTLLLLNLRSF